MGLTPHQFTEQARLWHETLKDDVVGFASLEYQGAGQLVSHELTLEGIATGGYINDTAMSQLDHMLKVPHRWVISEDCPDELYTQILAWKMKHLNKKQLQDRVLLRKRELVGTTLVRAILSDEYTPLDNFDLASSIEEALKEQGVEDVRVIRPQMGDTMRAYYLLPKIRFDTDEPGHSADGGGSGGLSPAIYVTNSEVGKGSIRITGGLYRNYCENGTVIGWRETSSDKLIHRWITKRLLSMHAAEYIAAALQMSEEAALRYIKLQGMKVPAKSIKSIIEGWTNKYGLLAQAEDWLKSCTSLSEHTDSDGLTMFDVINEATYLAKQQNPDVREQLEIMAGDMIMNVAY